MPSRFLRRSASGLSKNLTVRRAIVFLLARRMQHYNYRMRCKRFRGGLTLLTMLLLFGIGALSRLPIALADGHLPALPSQVSASELIMAMNTLRVSYGLPALIEDPIVDAVAQATAATMAANELSWHIGNVRGRLAAAGYGNGGIVWA